MSRNSEKAQSMLYRFREQQAAEMGIVDLGRTRRPKAISAVDSLPNAEKWRAQVVREISRKITKIQSPSLTEAQIRDLNDDINRLVREKHVWEIRIRDLGGPNYMHGGGGAGAITGLGAELPNARGYRYFGRAKELPGVKELFESVRLRHKDQPPDEPQSEAAKAQSLYESLDLGFDYYGYDEDEDSRLEAVERKWDQETRQAASGGDYKPPILIDLPPVPDKAEIEQMLVEHRRRQLEARLD